MARGRPFQPGNKFGRGRPPGSRNRIKREAHMLLEEYEGPVVKKSLSLALQGHVPMLRAFLNYYTQNPVNVGRFKTQTLDDLAQAQQVLLRKAAAGQVPAREAKQLDDLIASRRQLIEAQAFENRIRRLEEKQEERELLEASPRCLGTGRQI